MGCQYCLNSAVGRCQYCGPQGAEAAQHDEDQLQHQLATLTAERDRITAELAAAKEDGFFGRMAGKLATERDAATARADAAEAHVADLRGALEELKAEYEDPAVRDDARKVTYMWSLSIIRAALTRTPAQSLGRIKAAALREAEDAIAKRTEERPGRFGGYTVDDARRDLLIAADRLEASHD